MTKKTLENIKGDSAMDVHSSGKARSRLNKRYASESRFRIMGLCSVLVSALFLTFLLFTIIRDALPVLSQHYIMLETELKAEDIAPDGDRSSSIIGNANYGGMIKKWLRSEFPKVKNRKDKKALSGLVSLNAGSVLQHAVLDNPDLIGTTQKFEVLSSDYADLYFKGSVANKQPITTTGIASPIGTDGEIRILSTSNDFRNILSEIKLDLATQNKVITSDVAGQLRLIERLTDRVKQVEEVIKDSGGELLSKYQEQLMRLKLDLEAAKTSKTLLQEQSAALKTRIEAIGAPEQLSREMPSYIISVNGGKVKVTKVSATEISGTVILPLSSEADSAKGTWAINKVMPSESRRKLSDKEIIWLDNLKANGHVVNRFNSQFFTVGASREAEVAGIWGAVVGTFYTMLITLLLSFPIGVGAAIYLEEFAPKNWITHVIEVNINNLAAVPSIVFGLLGLAMFLNFFGMPRSAPIVGGMVLALMTLPTIIIASRAALKAVPPSIKEAALGIGASNMQAVFHHSLPLAMPGILTGSILGMAQALGETAPLLMIGMVAFIVDIPGASGFLSGFTDPATVLPVQIYMWADFPEQAFQYKTAAAILVLLTFLILMNAIAVILRKKFERRW